MTSRERPAGQEEYPIGKASAEHAGESMSWGAVTLKSELDRPEQTVTRRFFMVRKFVVPTGTILDNYKTFKAMPLSL